MGILLLSSEWLHGQCALVKWAYAISVELFSQAELTSRHHQLTSFLTLRCFALFVFNFSDLYLFIYSEALYSFCIDQCLRLTRR